MRKTTIFIILCAIFFSGCNNAQTDISAEIKIPIYENETKTLETVKAATMNLSAYQAVPATVEYLYAEEIYSHADTNLLEINVKVNQLYNKGDVLIVLDSSALTYDLNNQQILTNSAEQRYRASGSESDRLEYLIEQKKLEFIQYKIDSYTIKAPYDCIIVSTERFTIGDAISRGTLLFKIAHPDDIYIYCNEKTSDFKIGMDVTVKLGNVEYSGRVVSCPAATPATADRQFKNIAIIKMNDGELERLLTDTPNAVTAGWATVYITASDKRNVLAVPSKAVKNFNGMIYCNLVQDNKKVQVQIETAEEINGYTIILSGINENDTLSFN